MNWPIISIIDAARVQQKQLLFILACDGSDSTGNLYPNPSRCDSFIQCAAGGIPTVMNCSNTDPAHPLTNGNYRLFFNETIQTCNWPAFVECVEVHSTCFQARDDKPGRFPVKGGYITDIKVTRTGGVGVTCDVDNGRANTFWGCGVGNLLNVYIADDARNRILPIIDRTFFFNFYQLRDPTDETGQTLYTDTSPSLLFEFGDNPHKVVYVWKHIISL